MRRVALLLLIAAVAGALLAGCSGAGAPADENAVVRALARDNVDAAVLIASWVRAIYVRNVQILSFTHSHPEPNRYIADRIYVDGTTDHSEVDETTRCGVTTTAFPDGTGATQTVTPLPSEGTEGSWHCSTVYSNGATVEQDVILLNMRPITSEYRGTATTPGGSMADFVVNQQSSARNRPDRVEVTLRNGTNLKMSVSRRLVFGGYYWPQYQEATTGQFTTRRGNTLNFTLRGSTAEAWDTLRVTGSDGTTGSFTLGEGLSGSGEIRKDGQAIATLTWDRNGNGEVEIIDATYDLAPSAAARDFQIANWAYRVSVLGPVSAF